MDALQRLLSKVIVDPITGCWLYQGGCFDDGYGAFWCEGKTQRAHRASMKLHGKELSEDQQALHTCDVSICINPDHLYAGSHQDNMDDLKIRGNAKGIPKSEEWKVKARAVDPEKRRQAVRTRWNAKRTAMG